MNYAVSQNNVSESDGAADTSVKSRLGFYAILSLVLIATVVWSFPTKYYGNT